MKVLEREGGREGRGLWGTEGVGEPGDGSAGGGAWGPALQREAGGALRAPGRPRPLSSCRVLAGRTAAVPQRLLPPRRTRLGPIRLPGEN